jgi:hypothetical protein
LVCGGRTFGRPAFLFRTLDQLHAERNFRGFIQGGATGADDLAKRWARTHPEIKRWQCKADWLDLSHPDAVLRTRSDGTVYDAMAGHRRNARMLTWGPDVVVAFPGGTGTADMVKQARAAGVEVLEFS